MEALEYLRIAGVREIAGHEIVGLPGIRSAAVGLVSGLVLALTVSRIRAAAVALMDRFAFSGCPGLAAGIVSVGKV